MIAFLRANQRKNVPTRGNKFFIGIAQKRPSFAESKEYLHYKITLYQKGGVTGGVREVSTHHLPCLHLFIHRRFSMFDGRWEEYCERNAVSLIATCRFSDGETAFFSVFNKDGYSGAFFIKF